MKDLVMQLRQRGVICELQREYRVEFGVVRNMPERKKDAIFSSNRASAAKKVILYQGMPNHGRGLEVAIDALRLLPSDYQLWLAGNGDLLARLQILRPRFFFRE